MQNFLACVEDYDNMHLCMHLCRIGQQNVTRMHSGQNDELRALGGADEAGSSSDSPLAPSSA